MLYMRILTFCVLYCTVLPCYSWSLCGNCCEYKPNQIIAAYSIEPKNDIINSNNSNISNKNNKIYFIVNEKPFETLLVKAQNNNQNIKIIENTAFVDGTTFPYEDAGSEEFSSQYIWYQHKLREKKISIMNNNKNLFGDNKQLKKGEFFTLDIKKNLLSKDCTNTFYYFEKIFYGSYIGGCVFGVLTDINYDINYYNKEEYSKEIKKRYTRCLTKLLTNIFEEIIKLKIKYLFIPIDFFDRHFKFNDAAIKVYTENICKMTDVTIIFIFRPKKFSNMIVHKDKFIKSMTDKLRENNTVTKIKHDKCFYIDNNTE